MDVEAVKVEAVNVEAVKAEAVKADAVNEVESSLYDDERSCAALKIGATHFCLLCL